MGKITPFVHGHRKHATVRGSGKPTGSGPRAPGCGTAPRVFGAYPHSSTFSSPAPSSARSLQVRSSARFSRARYPSVCASRAPTRLGFPLYIFWGGGPDSHGLSTEPWPAMVPWVSCSALEASPVSWPAPASRVLFLCFLSFISLISLCMSFVLFWCLLKGIRVLMLLRSPGLCFRNDLDYNHVP